MVVVSASWMKNVANYPPSIINSEIVPSHERKMAKAILICRPNSHHFQERTLTLDQPIKIGRSVARAKPTSVNAIFDCKVLSRHHALLWYEDGKFYLQDTKSSNGTFVNNNKLSAETENHELSSGDIVQFGVDVVENNKKVTHGCIIATIKLYLPDGKEAKASPSITDSDRHGVVPLDDLYRLNQVIQEANQREQCLETKLTALQQIVDETRKSAEESWQAYVGEERLLSRVSALENQLQQANKSWGDDRIREELIKLKEDNEAYQIAAKEALEKLHTERLQAVALAMEQERGRIAAEQETFLAKEQFTQAQLELEEIAKRLAEHQEKSEEQRIRLEQRAQELEAKLEEESDKALDFELKLRELKALSNRELQNMEEKQNVICNNLKSKEEILAENEVGDSVLNKSNGINNHISLMVHPVIANNESDNTADDESTNSDDTIFNQKKDFQEDIKKVTFNISDDSDDKNDSEFGFKNNKENKKKDDTYSSEHVDSKTLKYQSAQNESKRRIEHLELMANNYKRRIEELADALHEEQMRSAEQLEENANLKLQMHMFEWCESSDKNEHQNKIKYSVDDSEIAQNKSEVDDHLGENRINAEQKSTDPPRSESCNDQNETKYIVDDLEVAQNKVEEVDGHSKENQTNVEQKNTDTTPPSHNVYTNEQLMNLEEELVILKERFAQIGEEKVQLQRDLLTMTEKYNMACNHSYNKYFFYVAPLVFMVLYLLVSAMIS